MIKLNILLAGVGGQGVVLASDILADVALEALFELSKGDETIAAQALKTAIAGHGQSFLWCFNQKNHQLTLPHVANQHHQNSPQESGLQFGADNLRWLELHARTEREEIGPELQ